MSIVPFYLSKGVNFLKTTFIGAESPAGTLEEINKLARRELEVARLQKIEPSQTASRLYESLDTIAYDAQKAHRRAQHPLAEEIDWKRKAEDNQADLIEKLSALVTFIQMRDRCGLPKTDTLILMKLAKETTEGNLPSVWKLFNDQYQTKLSWVGRVKAAWVYWVYYKSSLITKTLATYVGSFIDTAKKELTAKNSENLNDAIHKLLESADDFLSGDSQATRKFAKEGGILRDRRDEAIDAHFDRSIEDQGKAFSQKRVKADFIIPLFETLQKVPILGRPFRTFEWFINRFFIQSYMKNVLLPNLITKGFDDGIKTTSPQNLSIGIQLTRFLIARYEEFKVKLDSDSPPPEVVSLPGVKERLSPVIQHLREVLDLESIATQSGLQNKFAQMDDQSTFNWLCSRFDQWIDNKIEEGIITGGQVLSKSLNDTAQSGELFARLLGIACEAFPASVEQKDPDTLLREYNREKEKLTEVRNEVVKKVINQEIWKYFNGVKPLVAKEKVNESLAAREKVSNKVLDELSILCQNMRKKIAERINVHADITSFLKILEVFSGQKEVKNTYQDLRAVNKSPLWQTLTPLYQRLHAVQERLFKQKGLNDLQSDFPKHSALPGYFRSIEQVLGGDLNSGTIRTLKESAKNIQKCLKSDDLNLKSMIIEIEENSFHLDREQKILQAISSLTTGPLAKFRKNRSRTVLNQIINLLSPFLKDEKNELISLIRKLDDAKDWDRLKNRLEEIKVVHTRAKDGLIAFRNQMCGALLRNINGKATKYEELAAQDYAQMQTEIGEISIEINAIRAALLNPPLEATLSKRLTPVTLGAIGASVASVAAFYSAPILAVPLAGLLAGLAFGAKYYASQRAINFINDTYQLAVDDPTSRAHRFASREILKRLS